MAEEDDTEVWIDVPLHERVLCVGTVVRIDDSDDDWPGRVGVIGSAPVRPGNVWVQFEDGEGGEYPPAMVHPVSLA